MATESFLETVVITDRREVKKFDALMNAPAPRSDIKAFTYAELERQEKDAEELVKLWKTQKSYH